MLRIKQSNISSPRGLNEVRLGYTTLAKALYKWSQESTMSKDEYSKVADTMDRVSYASICVLQKVFQNNRILGPFEADFLPLYESVMTTLEKRPNVYLEADPIFDLLSISAYLYCGRGKALYASKLKMNFETV